MPDWGFDPGFWGTAPILANVTGEAWQLSWLWLFCLGRAQGTTRSVSTIPTGAFARTWSCLKFIQKDEVLVFWQGISRKLGNQSNIWHFFSICKVEGEDQGDGQAPPNLGPQHLRHALHQDSPAELEAAGLGRAVVRARRKKGRGRSIAVGFEPLVLVSRVHIF